MKKTLSVLLAASLVWGEIASVSATTSLSVKVNGAKLNDSPAMVDGRTMVPLRGIFEALGAQLEWDAKEQIIDAYKNGEMVFRTQIGWQGAYLGPDQKEISLDVSPQIIDGKTMVPTRFVAESIGASVDWDSATSTVFIETSGKATPGASSAVQSAIGKKYANKLQALLPQLTENRVSLSSASYQTLAANGDLFFGNRDANSLDGKTEQISYGLLAKNVAKYESTILELSNLRIDDIREFQKDGDTVTEALAHWGGTTVDPVYVQIVYYGSNNITKGDLVTVRALPVGESIVYLTDAFGREYTQPMYVVVAGNFGSVLDNYFYEKEKGQNQPIELTQEAQDYMEQMRKIQNSDGGIPIDQLSEQAKKSMEQYEATQRAVEELMN